MLRKEGVKKVSGTLKPPEGGKKIINVTLLFPMQRGKTISELVPLQLATWHFAGDEHVMSILSLEEYIRAVSL